jgi:hypothetical protein
MASVRFKRRVLIALPCALYLLAVLLVIPTSALQRDSQFHILTGTLILDLYTKNGGIGANAPGGLFHPGDKIVLYANVTYNGDAVAGVLVSFEVTNPLNNVTIMSTAIADFHGLAKINFTIPSMTTQGIFGTWTTIATTSVAQIFASDRLTFQVMKDSVNILGDINGDGIVDINDATLVSVWWRSLSPPAPTNVDINGDGEIDISDATIIAMNWQRHA